MRVFYALFVLIFVLAIIGIMAMNAPLLVRLIISTAIVILGVTIVDLISNGI